MQSTDYKHVGFVRNVVRMLMMRTLRHHQQFSSSPRAGEQKGNNFTIFTLSENDIKIEPIDEEQLNNKMIE